MRAWRTKGKSQLSIRKTHHNTPGKGTLADHITSHQSGLILQVTGTLTCERYWGVATMVDLASIFRYSHMIKSTSTQETLDA
eukprot:6215163-Ditylum_brightwellii.AAC.1